MSPSWPCWLVQRSAGPIGSGALASGSIRFFSSKMSSSWPCWLVQHSVGPIGPGAPDSDSMRPRHAGQGHAQHGQAERFASAAFVLHRQEFKSTCSRPCSPVVSVLLPSCMRVRFHVTHVPSLPAHSLLPSHHIPSCPNSVALSSFPPRLPSLPLLLSLLLLLVHEDASKQKICMHSRGVPPFHKSKTAQKFCFQVPSVHDLHC